MNEVANPLKLLTESHDKLAVELKNLEVEKERNEIKKRRKKKRKRNTGGNTRTLVYNNVSAAINGDINGNAKQARSAIAPIHTLTNANVNNIFFTSFCIYVCISYSYLFSGFYSIFTRTSSE